MTREEAIKMLKGRIRMLHDADPRRYHGLEPYESTEEKLFKVCLAALEEVERNKEK